ncbi:hypothetical protein PMI07_000870 [Rhizobium sp. CF080]|uniref:hypothetical protein n=1 Tax=Rhizobium sp. (strain CF080) TaxID=1144310 RepID=UPI000271CD35|nr:hypothetical protein [Rhizobium sp. CF080]EUB97294.1 hypothetical protein PMI07_000870 [Rhizobium sp. CF080]
MAARTKNAAAPAKSSKKALKPLKTKAAKADEKTAVDEMVVNQTEMAAVLGVTTRWLREQTAAGIVPTEGRGRFKIGAVVQAYIAYSKEGAVKKTGTESLDDLRKEKALDIRLARARKDREVIALDEAISTAEELAGLFVSSLVGLPAQITGVPRERQRLNDIFDAERLRLTDRFTKRIATLRTGEEDPDSTAED